MQLSANKMHQKSRIHDSTCIQLYIVAKKYQQYISYIQVPQQVSAKYYIHINISYTEIEPKAQL